MRFDELTLERYGAFESRALAFGPGLTVVYGANEAGKSTSLSAVGDFLFGIPNVTARGAVFGYERMRLGARLTCADGATLQLTRRRGKGRTLIDQSGSPVDETALSALLGSTTRERFDTLFGLDHERLRRGGERLLAADGEIGRLIVEAGGGLRSLVGRLEAIDQTLDRLFSTRRSGERAFYKALDAYDAADRDAKAGALTRERYEQSRTGHTEAKAEVAGLRDARRALAVETSALERMARVIPLLRELDRLDQALGGFADLPDLPDGFDTTVAAAEAGRRDAVRALTDAESTLANLSARHAAIVVDDRLAAEEAQALDAQSRGVIVHNARGDRPNRVKELTQAESQIEGLRRLIGAAPGEDIAGRLPAPEAVEAVRRLAAAAQARAPKRAAAQDRIAELGRLQGRIAERIAVAAAAGFDRPSGVAVAAFAALAAETLAAAAKRRAAEAAWARIEDRARALGFADVGAARALRCPDADAVTLAVSRETALSEARLRQIEAAAAAEAQRDAALAAIERLRSGGEIATDAALAAARAARAAAWAQVRSAHLAGRADPDPVVRAGEVEALDRSLGAADELADRRAGEAHRVAELAQAERQRDAAIASLAAAAKAQAAIEEAARTAQAELAAAFPNALERVTGATALKGLADALRALLADADAAEAGLADAAAAERGLDAPRAALAFAERSCGLTPGPDAETEDRVRAAAAAAARRDLAYAEHARDLRSRDEAATDLERAQVELQNLEREDAVWSEAWGPALARLGLNSRTLPEDAATAAHEWAGARGVLEAIGASRRRIARMDEDEADLARRVAVIGAAIGLALPEDAVAASRMLTERFKANDEARRKRETLAPDVGDAERTVALRRAEVEACEAALAALASAAGLADAAGLSTVARRHAARAALAADVARAEANVVTSGDGQSVEALRAAAADRDLDAVRADLGAAETRAGDLDDALHAAIRVEHEAETVLDGHHAAAGVNRAVVLRESATAELHDVVERYVELALARDLVEAAIQRVRAERQDPLVARAGALFALATQAAFSGVGTDVDDKGEPVVVGVRAGGGTVGAAAMSDGTRDQLFLAFRLASVEAYCAATEPLPFVADDVLVHFDDARSRATLELLADFAGVTQVLLFTHHLSVRRMAEDLGTGRCRIVELG